MFKRIIFILLLIFLLSVNTVLAETYDALKGIEGVHVYVFTDKEPTLSESVTISAIEQLLRQSNIKVISSLEEKLKDKNAAVLSCDVMTKDIKSKSGYITFTSSISMYVWDHGYLKRMVKKGIKQSFPVITWNSVKLITASKEREIEYSLETIREMTKQFINDYLAANN